MSAKTNFILIIDKIGDSALLNALSAIWRIAVEKLGPLKTLMVLDYERGTEATDPMESGEPQLPEFGPHELVFFYPATIGTGSVSVCRGANFSVATLSVAHEPNIELLLRCLWSVTRDCDIRAILAGEELEVTDAEVDAIMRGDIAPTKNDLCSLAVVTDQWVKKEALARVECCDESTYNGGILFRKHR